MTKDPEVRVAFSFSGADLDSVPAGFAGTWIGICHTVIVAPVTTQWH